MTARMTLIALLSHWRKRPFQCLTLVLGLSLATALWSGVQALNAEARASYDDASEAITGSRPILVPAQGMIPDETYVALRRTGWQVSPVVEGWIGTESGRIRVVGIDPFTAPNDMAAASSALSESPSEVFLSPGRLFVTQSQQTGFREPTSRLS